MEFKAAKDIDKTKAMYLIFGNPGTGKTTTATYLPGKTLLVAIDGSDRVLKDQPNIDVVELDKVDVADIVHQFNKILDAIEVKYLDKYDNIAFDNLSHLQDIVLSQLSMTNKDQRKAWGDMQNLIKQWIGRIRSWNKSIYATAWEMTETFENNDGTSSTYYDVLMNAKVRASVKGLFDVVGQTFIYKNEHVVRLTPNGQSQVKNQVDKRNYCLTKDLFNGKEWLPNMNNTKNEEIKGDNK